MRGQRGGKNDRTPQCLGEAVNHYYTWRMGINPTPTLGSAIHLSLEDGNNPHPLIGISRLYSL